MSKILFQNLHFSKSFNLIFYPLMGIVLLLHQGKVSSDPLKQVYKMFRFDLDILLVGRMKFG